MYAFTQMQRGILLIFIGGVMLLHALKIVQFRYDIFLAGLGVYLIVCGLMATGYYDKIVAMLKNRGPKVSE